MDLPFSKCQRKVMVFLKMVLMALLVQLLVLRVMCDVCVGALCGGAAAAACSHASPMVEIKPRLAQTNHDYMSQLVDMWYAAPKRTNNPVRILL